MKSLNRKIKEALGNPPDPYGNYIELRLNELEYKEFTELEGVERVQYNGFGPFRAGGPCASGEQLYFKYNGNYWVPRIYDDGREPIEMYVKVPVLLDPMYYAHIESEKEMLELVKSHTKEHFSGMNIIYEIPQEFINEYRRLRQ